MRISDWSSDVCSSDLVTTTFWGIPLAEILVMGLLIERTITSVGKVQREVQKAAAVESAFWSAHQLVEEAGAEAGAMGGSSRPSLTPGWCFQHVRFDFGHGLGLEGLGTAHHATT